jgi:hypothetical protein
MNYDPTRLVDDERTEHGARALLNAGRRHAAVHYDVAAGAQRFGASLKALGAAQATVSTASVTSSAALVKGIVLLLSGVGALVVSAYRTELSAFFVPRGTEVRVAERALPGSQVEVREDTALAVGSTAHAAARNEREQAAEMRAPTSREPRASEKRVALLASARGPARGRGRVLPEQGAALAGGARLGAEGRGGDYHPDDHHQVHDHTHGQERVSRGEQPEDPQPVPVAEAKPEALPAPAAKPEPLDELRATAEARRLVVRSPRAALALLTRLAAEHPRGYFVEEREALSILALVADGQQKQAERAAQTFLQRHPGSPFADRVQHATAH